MKRKNTTSNPTGQNTITTTPTTTSTTTKKVVIDSGSKRVWPFPDIVTMGWHVTGFWRWTYKQKHYYFPADPVEALAEWRNREPVITGRMVAAEAPRRDGVTVDVLLNRWLSDKHVQVETGALSAKTYAGYKHTARIVKTIFGGDRLVDTLTPEDFAHLLKVLKVGIYKRKDFVVTVRSIFNWAVDDAKIIHARPAFGVAFDVPSAKQLRSHRARTGDRALTAAQVFELLRITRKSPEFHAMAWLGINCAMSHADFEDLEWGAFHAQELRWLRPKTMIGRVCWVWPETLRALDRLPRAKGVRAVFPELNPTRITHTWRVIFALAGMDDSHGHYDLRRTFATVAASSSDYEARKLAMGHALPVLDETYIRTFPVSRVKALSGLVRTWLRAGRPSRESESEPRESVARPSQARRAES